MWNLYNNWRKWRNIDFSNLKSFLCLCIFWLNCHLIATQNSKEVCKGTYDDHSMMMSLTCSAYLFMNFDKAFLQMFSNLATHLPHCMPFNIPSDSQVRCKKVGHLKKVNNSNAFRQVNLEKDKDILYATSDHPLPSCPSNSDVVWDRRRAEFYSAIAWNKLPCPKMRDTEKSSLWPPTRLSRQVTPATDILMQCFQGWVGNSYLTTKTSWDVGLLRCMMIAALISCLLIAVQGALVWLDF